MRSTPNGCAPSSALAAGSPDAPPRKGRGATDRHVDQLERCLADQLRRRNCANRTIDRQAIDLNSVFILLPCNQSNEEILDKRTRPTHVAEFSNLILGLKELWDPVEADEASFDRVSRSLNLDDPSNNLGHCGVDRPEHDHEF